MSTHKVFKENEEDLDTFLNRKKCNVAMEWGFWSQFAYIFLFSYT